MWGSSRWSGKSKSASEVIHVYTCSVDSYSTCVVHGWAQPRLMKTANRWLAEAAWEKRNDGAWRAWMTVIHNLRFVIHENSGYGNRYWNNSGWTSRVYIHTSFTILTDAAPQEEKHQKGIVRWPFWPVNSQYLVDSRLSCSSIVTCNQSKNSPA